MLQRLSIRGLALIDTLVIEFSSGLNVLTGETGAGKSILIRALQMAVGGRVGTEAIRHGMDQAQVIAEFWISEAHPVWVILEKYGLADGERGPLILRRQVNQKGRSQGWINDVPVQTNTLKEVGSTLIDIFGQHENQRLLQEEHHTDYLDALLGNDIRARYGFAFQQVEAGVRELLCWLEGLGRRRTEADYLQFRLEELSQFAPSAEDHIQLQGQVALLREQEKQKEILQEALERMESAQPAEVLRSLQKRLQRAAIASLEEMGERVARLAQEFEEIHFELSRLAEGQGEGRSLEQLEERIYGYRELFRKHQVLDAESLHAKWQELHAEATQLESWEEPLAQRLQALEIQVTELEQLARQLTRARKKGALLLKGKIEQEFQDLAMPEGIFEIEFAPGTPKAWEPEGAAWLETPWRQRIEKLLTPLQNLSSRGAEKGRFLLSANRGENPLPLAKTASGGELSRVMLAIKKSLAMDAETCVMVFDEIDTGISGSVADRVGEKLVEIAQNVQVLCISHLPQVAVYADTHFRVEKASQGERTTSTLVRLNAEESLMEVARLLSGRQVTSSSLRHARELKNSKRKGTITP